MRLGPLGEGRRWLEQAREDLYWAEDLAGRGGYHIACFLAQQVGVDSIHRRGAGGNPSGGTGAAGLQEAVRRGPDRGREGFRVHPQPARIDRREVEGVPVDWVLLVPSTAPRPAASES